MNIVAYVDEAGEKGFSRNLIPDCDPKIGLMCALAYPAEKLEQLREAYRDGFDRFCAGAPAGEKIHFTSAFKPGNEAWAIVAHVVREEFFQLIRTQTIPIIYDARRLALQREGHERLETLKAEAKKAKQSRIRIPERPSAAKIETQLIEGLTLKLDALAIDLNCAMLDLYFDEIDIGLSQHYEQTIERLRHINANTDIVKGYDPSTKQQVSGSISLTVGNAGFDIDIKRIGKIKVIGKDDPLILATDAVANHLYRHLSGLLPNAKLNAPSSIEAWDLSDRVWGVREDAIEDII